MDDKKWILPKKWEVIDTELFEDKNDNRYSYTITTKYIILTVRFSQKKYWWSAPTFIDKKIACEMPSFSRIEAKYNDWFWFPEMIKFDIADYGVSFFGESGYTTAKRFRDYIGVSADRMNVSKQDGWQKILSNYKEDIAEANKPMFKETPSAYR